MCRNVVCTSTHSWIFLWGGVIFKQLHELLMVLKHNRTKYSVYTGRGLWNSTYNMAILQLRIHLLSRKILLTFYYYSIPTCHTATLYGREPFKAALAETNLRSELQLFFLDQLKNVISNPFSLS